MMSRTMRGLVLGLAVMAGASTANAELVLSQLVVDLGAGQGSRADIEIWNNSKERAYVAVDPNEILNAGSAQERRVAEIDPERRGLLVSPNRLILEPGQRRLVRFAPVGARGLRERVYRVTVKPVAGKLEAESSGLKLLIGYDVLVLLRPATVRPAIIASRSGNRLTLRNDGNASVELIDGKQCSASKTNCVDLPGKRLYAGAEWVQDLKSSASVEYTVAAGGRSVRQSF